MRIKKNKKVGIVYQILSGKGEILAETSSQSPVYYLHGYKNRWIVPGLESALEGHSDGDEFSVTLPFEVAYGTYDPKLIFEVSKDELIPDVPFFQLGSYIEYSDFNDFYDDDKRWQTEIENSDEHRLEGIIREIRENSIILDGNHPYAGLDLVFKVRIIWVGNASVMELEKGYPNEAEDEDGDDDYDYGNSYFED
ncbi:peptidyl-prolyl cis-trans isomerase [Fibrobacterales bacterium]|nr:peptidyl-prolyl cis-trans isomerase [Fibrobacterales bacterium]